MIIIDSGYITRHIVRYAKILIDYTDMYGYIDYMDIDEFNIDTKKINLKFLKKKI